MYSRFHGLIKYNWLVYGLAFMDELITFWRTLWYIHGRVSSTGGKVLRCSQWALLPTAVCPEKCV